MTTLWAADTQSNNQIGKFTTGKDRELDLHLAKYDVIGSIAHISMLQTINLITIDELSVLKAALIEILDSIEKGDFTIENGVEDVHSQVEFLLTKNLGDVGKKIHSGRSRNDQVLVDLKLFMRDKLEFLTNEITILFNLLQTKSELCKNELLPGYTHFQVAMPSSFGLWFGAYAEALVDDVIGIRSAYNVVNKNPLGSAAGYGSSFPLNRTLTTQLLGFDDLNYNVIYAQMTRGKTDFIVANCLASVAYTLNKLATDVVLYVNQNYDFISFPNELMEGSSIMPHKKNPDVFELIRAKTNKIKALPNEINLLTTNMPSGYHRDWQILKENIIPVFDDLTACIRMTCLMLEQIIVKKNIALDPKYKYMFSVDKVNALVLTGIPFRDAYKIIAKEINDDIFQIPNTVTHTHEGSIGNLCNENINAMYNKVISEFGFDVKNMAIKSLLK